MTGIRETVAECPDLAALVHQRIVHALRYQHGGDRQIGRRQRLGDRNRMRPIPECLAAEHAAEPSEAGDDLVGDHQQVVAVAHGHDFFEIRFWRHDDAARPHDGFGDEGRDRIGVLAQNQLFEFGGKPRRERLLALPVQSVTVVMRAGGVQDAGNRQIEIRVVGRQPGERGRRDGDPVIGALAADDLLLARAAECVVHVPDELHLGVVRLGAGIAEEHFRYRYRRDLLQLFRQFDSRVVAAAGE